MTTLSKPHTFSSGGTIFASEHNNNFNTIYNDYNGNITNLNISGSAAIDDTKLDLASIAQTITFNGATTFSAGVTFAGQTIADLGTVTTANIDGGTVDGVIIGGSSTAAGSFTTANLSLDLNMTETTDPSTAANEGALYTKNGTSETDLFFRSESDGNVTQITKAGSVISSTETFVNSGTWTCPTGITRVLVTMCGAGGGGASSNASVRPGGGGGSGATILNHTFPTTAGQAYTVTVGTGGAGGTAEPDNGSNGTQSQFFKTSSTPYTLTCAPGVGGRTTDNSNGGTAGAGAAVSVMVGGDASGNTAGAVGSYFVHAGAVGGAGSTGGGGAGASCYLGAIGGTGGTGGAGASPGGAALGPGAGGGGAGLDGGTTDDGGAGGDGICNASMGSTNMIIDKTYNIIAQLNQICYEYEVVA